MQTLLILNDAPYGTERTYNGLRLGLALAKTPDAHVTIVHGHPGANRQGRGLNGLPASGATACTPMTRPVPVSATTLIKPRVSKSTKALGTTSSGSVRLSCASAVQILEREAGSECAHVAMLRTRVDKTPVFFTSPRGEGCGE